MSNRDKAIIRRRIDKRADIWQLELYHLVE